MTPDSKPFIIPIFIPHAGCPHRCIFCNQEHTTGAAAELPTEDVIKNHITEFLSYRKNRGRWTEISYYGGNFLGLPRNQIRQLLSIATAHVHSGAVDGIRFSTRPDTITPDRLAAIADFHVSTIELGAQSMDDRVLSFNNRGHSAQDTLQAVGVIRKRMACHLGLQMMIGLAGDSFASVMGSAEQLGALAPDFIRIYPTLVLKGSALEEWYANGSYQPLALEEAVTQTKAVLQHFSALGIPVIRMGLQPTEELNPEVGVVAGPFHPAFGELVRAALWRDRLVDVLARYDRFDGRISRGTIPIETTETTEITEITVKVNPHCLSQAKGQQNANTDYLNRRFSSLKIEISPDKAIPKDMADINDRRYPLGISHKDITHGHQSRT